jgi:hypothetical protein
MSEHLGSTQPNIKVKVRKSWRGRTFLFNALGLIVILILAILAGYGSGISVRKNNQTSVISTARRAISIRARGYEFGDAQMRVSVLEYIIQQNPPSRRTGKRRPSAGAMNEGPTPTITPSLTHA